MNISALMKLKRLIGLFAVNHFLTGTHFYKAKRALMRFAGIRVGKNTKVVGPVFLGTQAQLSIGDDCWIGKQLTIHGNGEVAIGNNIDIAPDVMFLTGSHEISNDNIRKAGKGQSFIIEICDGSWIGARSTIMGNTRIGKMNVIGACALVRESTEDNCKYGGIPAVKLS